MFIYPWGDFHSLNLGWFLVQFKQWTEKIQEYLDNGGGTSENLANVIAPVFNAENSYLTGDYVLYNDELYKANQAVNPGTWNPDAWTRCLVTEEMGSGSGGVDNVARLMIAGQYSNTYNYQKYAICRYNDKLWMCNTNLPAGGEEWEPTHWDEITVGAGLTGLRRSADTLSNAIVDLQNIVGDGTLSGFTASNLTGAVNELKGSIDDVEDITGDGQLSGFTATDLTGAANELKGSLNSVQNQITANIETSATASKAYSANEYLVLNGTLYKVVSPIANGAQITIGTNVIATNISNELNTAIKTLGFLKTGINITGDQIIGTITIPAGKWLLVYRIHTNTAGEVAILINGTVTIHDSALTLGYVYGYDIAAPESETIYTLSTNSWTSATIDQLYVECIPIIETRTII